MDRASKNIVIFLLIALLISMILMYLKRTSEPYISQLKGRPVNKPFGLPHKYTDEERQSLEVENKELEELHRDIMKDFGRGDWEKIDGRKDKYDKIDYKMKWDKLDYKHK